MKATLGLSRLHFLCAISICVLSPNSFLLAGYGGGGAAASTAPHPISVNATASNASIDREAFSATKSSTVGNSADSGLDVSC